MTLVDVSFTSQCELVKTCGEDCEKICRNGPTEFICYKESKKSYGWHPGTHLTS